MKALVLAAHGSRREASNEEVIMLSRTIEQDMSNEYAVVRAGFLEQAKPSISDAIENCVKLGAIEVVVVPYFLSAGRHVVEDVPAELDKARSNHKNISITITPHIGSSPKMQDVIREAAMNNELPN
jgi:sirohydrochlorin ferrochelatase